MSGLAEDGSATEDFIGVRNFLYTEITEDGLAEKIADADRELKEYYAEKDAEKKEI